MPICCACIAFKFTVFKLMLINECNICNVVLTLMIIMLIIGNGKYVYKT